VGAKIMYKPTFSVEQLVTASVASKHFGVLRKKAKLDPQFITDNGTVDTVLMGYEFFEKMYQRLIELEKKEEAGILAERIESIENDPLSAVPWRKVRRSSKTNE
jgi:hypothetical protein